MEPVSYTYHRPQSVAEACELGRRFGASGRFLAGGTELMVDLRNGRDMADHVISLRDVDELRHIEYDDDMLHVGSLATLSQIAGSADVLQAYPTLAEAARGMAGVQIRNQGTIGGNFCRGVPCADTPPICIVGGAQVQLVGPDGKRRVPASEFFLGARQTVRRSDELLTRIEIPEQPAASGASYQRFSLRKSQALAVAAVAARVVLAGGKSGKKATIESATVVLNAVAPVPLPVTACAELLAGQPPGQDLFAEAARQAAEAAQPIDDIRGTAAYRRHLVEVLTLRALNEATERAGGEPA